MSAAQPQDSTQPQDSARTQGSELRLENAYRRALRFYPAAWRRENEDVVVSTLLDVADHDARTTPNSANPKSAHPSSAELRHLAVSGIATRFGFARHAAAREAASTAALATGFVLAVTFFVAYTWAPWADRTPYQGSSYQTFGPFMNAGFVLYAVWAAAFVLGTLGKATAVRWLMVAAITISIGLRLLTSASWVGPTTTTCGFFGILSLVVLAGAPRGGRRFRGKAETEPRATSSAPALITFVVFWFSDWYVSVKISL